MTILDVLRYPVNDIYNNEQLLQLPRDLLKQWVEDCIAEVMARTIKFENVYPDKVAGIIYAIVRTTSCKASRGRDTDHFEELYKACYAARLKKMIAEYEPKD